MKKMFCIVGLTGSGKTTYLNLIMKNKNKYNPLLKCVHRFVYCTTRTPRFGEENGKDYFFYSKEEYDNLVKYNNDIIVETRNYHTENNGLSYYFTIQNNIKEDYYIAAPSIEQVKSLKDALGADKLAIIHVNVVLLDRVRRVLDNRIENDNDIYELCRRVVAEQDEWLMKDKEFEGIEDILEFDNNDSKRIARNSEKIMDWMAEIISRK